QNPENKKFQHFRNLFKNVFLLMNICQTWQMLCKKYLVVGNFKNIAGQSPRVGKRRIDFKDDPGYFLHYLLVFIEITCSVFFVHRFGMKNFYTLSDDNPV